MAVSSPPSVGAARIASMSSPSPSDYSSAASPPASDRDHTSAAAATATAAAESTPISSNRSSNRDLPTVARPTGVLGNVGASSDISSRSPHPQPTTPPAASRASMMALAGRIRGLEAESLALGKRLAGAEALRTHASLRIVHPQEGDIWYAGQACSITWVSRGTVRNLSVRIGSYVGSYVSSWQVVRDDIADTGNVTLALPRDTPSGWYCLRLSGSQVCTRDSAPVPNVAESQ